MSETILIPGTTLAGYRIERFVAQGGMGAVYEATQLSLDRRVALKLISERLGTDERFCERFRRESRTSASIDHPNILPVYEAGESNGRLFLAMRFVDGLDLSSLLKREGPLDAPTTVAILAQIGDALDAAHARGLIHRDVKPANVMLEAREAGWHAYLTDFGLAKPDDEEESEHTAPGEVLGTIDYMAPEQINGEPMDGRADVYAFGCMVYRCLTGEVPYKRETRTATLMAHANAPVPIPSERVAGLPAPLDFVVRRAMEKDPERRAQSAGTLMQWAATQLQGETAPMAAVTDESPTEETSLRPASEDPPAAGPRRRFAPRLALALALYAPIWTATYLLGRSL